MGSEMCIRDRVSPGTRNVGGVRPLSGVTRLQQKWESTIGSFFSSERYGFTRFGFGVIRPDIVGASKMVA